MILRRLRCSTGVCSAKVYLRRFAENVVVVVVVGSPVRVLSGAGCCCYADGCS